MSAQYQSMSAYHSSQCRLSISQFQHSISQCQHSMSQCQHSMSLYQQSITQCQQSISQCQHSKPVTIGNIVTPRSMPVQHQYSVPWQVSKASCSFRTIVCSKIKCITQLTLAQYQNQYQHSDISIERITSINIAIKSWPIVVQYHWQCRHWW